MNDVKYDTAIGRMPGFYHMHYVNVLDYFKTDCNAYVMVKKQTTTEVPLFSYKGKDNKIIKWVPIFQEALSRTFKSKGALVYIVQNNSQVPDVRDDLLTANANYGASV